MGVTVDWVTLTAAMAGPPFDLITSTGIGSTGLKVATAKDNSSSWSIASTMNSDVRSFTGPSDSLTSASALVGTARVAAEQQLGDIVGIKFQQIQEKVVQAAPGDGGPAGLLGGGCESDRFDFESASSLGVSISFFFEGLGDEETAASATPSTPPEAPIYWISPTTSIAPRSSATEGSFEIQTATSDFQNADLRADASTSFGSEWGGLGNDIL